MSADHHDSQNEAPAALPDTAQFDQNAFREWAAGDFYRLYRKNTSAALEAARLKAAEIPPDDRSLYSVVLMNVATQANLTASLFIGVKGFGWFLAVVTAGVLYHFVPGYWWTIPLILTLQVTWLDRVLCRRRAAAYLALSSVLASPTTSA